MEFAKARMPLKVAAKALGVDPQTLRVMIRMGVVDYGIAFKRPDSRSYTYVISPKKFYESTGYLWGEAAKDD